MVTAFISILSLIFVSVSLFGVTLMKEAASLFHKSNTEIICKCIWARIWVNKDTFSFSDILMWDVKFVCIIMLANLVNHPPSAKSRFEYDSVKYRARLASAKVPHSTWMNWTRGSD